jgi:opacity protein-like surface antigen
MRMSLLAAAAAIAVASPATARDGSGYIGIEGGILFPKDMNADRLVFSEDGLVITAAAEDISRIDLKRGYDVDLIGGYDLGLFRVEAELGYKRARGGDFSIDQLTRQTIELNTGEPLTEDDLDLDGGVSVWSLMANGLLDIGDGNLGAYAGGGIGRARVKTFGDRDNTWAWQAIVGVRTALTERIDAGVKYRYFRTGKVDFVSGDMDTGGPFSFDGEHRFRSHSLLLSLAYNFAAPDAPLQPPPPAAPVAEPPPSPPPTQTCVDGSVVLATDSCPVPPPPPPPPVPAPERG